MKGYIPNSSSNIESPGLHNVLTTPSDASVLPAVARTCHRSSGYGGSCILFTCWVSQSTKYGKPKFDEYWRSRARSGAKGSVAILSFVGGVYGAKGWRLVGSAPELRQLTLLASSYPELFLLTLISGNEDRLFGEWNRQYHGVNWPGGRMG